MLNGQRGYDRKPGWDPSLGGIGNVAQVAYKRDRGGRRKD